MTTRTIGLLAGIVSSAVGAWYWTRHQAARRERAGLTPARERGTVIFDNTPTATDDGQSPLT
jgi:hypothetical protein